MPPTRRSFLAHSAAGAAAGAAALAVPESAPAAPGTDVVSVAVIGCGAMGKSHLRNLIANPRVRVSYVCDVDAGRLAEAAKIAAPKHPGVKAVKDFRAVLDDQAVDAVWVATPDHWHTPAAVLALDAGKHVYVEKPCSHNVREGRLLVEAGARAKKVVQVGTQARSTKTVQEAIQRVRGGAIGDVLVAKAWNSQQRRDLGRVRPSDPPADLDFDLWLGPAPAAPFFRNRVHAAWRYFFDYGVGDMGNDGVHNVDVALWGLGVDALPHRVAALGGKYAFDDDQEWPDTQYAVAEFDVPAGKGSKGGAKQFIYEQRIWSPYVQEGYENGNAFYGPKGMLVMGHTVGWKLFGPGNKLVEQMTGEIDLVAHHNNFLAAITGDAEPAAPALAGHLAAGVCHLTNISGRLRRTVEFDPKAEAVTGQPAAQAMLARAYRPGHWAVPKGVPS